MVTSIKIDIFLLVTTRPIAHSERFPCIRNCVGEFGTDTGHSLVTNNVISNHLSYHGVCPCICSNDALCAHRRGRGDKHKN